MEPRTVTITTSPGPITLALQKVMAQFSSQGAHVSPGPLLKQLCKRLAVQESEDVCCQVLRSRPTIVTKNQNAINTNCLYHAVYFEFCVIVRRSDGLANKNLPPATFFVLKFHVCLNFACKCVLNLTNPLSPINLNLGFDSCFYANLNSSNNRKIKYLIRIQVDCHLQDHLEKKRSS